MPEETVNEEIQIPAWLKASAPDFEELDFEAPIKDSNCASSRELSQLFNKAIREVDGSFKSLDTAHTRVFSMLTSLTDMHFKPDNKTDPFGAMFILTDGTRSAIPSDFIKRLDIIEHIANKATHPVLKARAADLCWLLDRKRNQMANTAVSSYVEIVKKVENGTMQYQFSDNKSVVHHTSRDYLLRALHISNALGINKPEATPVKNMVKLLRVQAIQQKIAGPIHWFCDIDLNFGISDAKEIASSLDAFTKQFVSEYVHIHVDLLRLNARAHHIAKNQDEKNKCLSDAAELLASEALKKKDHAMLASNLLSSAIAQLHGIPGKKERRTELRHKLIDIQENIYEEMTSFSCDIDLTDLIKIAENAVAGRGLTEKLFIFADLEKSPDPTKLIEEAKDLINKHPFSHMFATSYHDRDGKVVYRTEGGENDSSVHKQVAQAESMRRRAISIGLIDVARQAIVSEHYISDYIFYYLLGYSSFVPVHLRETFSIGFSHFFNGDFTSATYILVPLLENSLRHVLKLAGYDVTIFDDATQIQKDRTISQLFEQMRSELDGIFGARTILDIENVFLSKMGPCLRHSLAHGLLHDSDPYNPDSIYGCWLIYRLCIMPLFPHWKEISNNFDSYTAEIYAIKTE